MRRSRSPPQRVDRAVRQERGGAREPESHCAPRVGHAPPEGLGATSKLSSAQRDCSGRVDDCVGGSIDSTCTAAGRSLEDARASEDRCAFARLAVYQETCRPLGVADSMRIYLPSPSGSARFFFFDRSSRGFESRSRTLRQLLRPHLVRAREHWRYPLDPLRVVLTRRQLEILSWVSRGLGNAEIAERLWISEHTVRKHLENINHRLGVRSRVAAAVAYLPSEPTRD